MYKRIIILGGSGSGKSTLASRISEYTGYPVYHLDNLLLESNWKEKDRSEWPDILNKILQSDIGIVDGNYTRTIPERINWADLIIFIDASTFVLLYRIFRRLFRVRYGLDKRLGMPNGAKPKVSFKFFKWVLIWNIKRKKKIFSMLESAKDKKVVIIKEPRKLDIKSLLE